MVKDMVARFKEVTAEIISPMVRGQHNLCHEVHEVLQMHVPEATNSRRGKTTGS